MKKYVLIIILATLVVLSCRKESQLKKSVLVYDQELTDLPAYSEWGYNTFGAYYDRDLFMSDSHIVPVKVLVTNNEMSFNLYGHYVSQDWVKPMTLTFTFPRFTPLNYTDLIVFNDTTFNLKDTTCKVIFTLDTTNYKPAIISGELNFKRAQNLKVDKKQIEVILSGYFDFKAIINGKPITVSDGRFDLGISQDNFYVY